MSLNKISVKSDALPVVFLLLMALCSLWPVFPSHVTDQLPVYSLKNQSTAQSDPLMFCWNLHWVNGWIKTNHPLLFCHSIHYPFGVSLSHHTLSIGNGFLAFVPLLFTSPVTSYNLILIFHAFVSGLGLYLLGRKLGADPFSSLIAGLIFMIWPVRIMHVTMHINIAGTACIPFAAWAMIRIVEYPIAKRIIPATVLITANILISWYHGVILLLLTPFLIFLKSKSNISKICLHLFLVWLFSAILISPLIFQMILNPSDVSPRQFTEIESFSISPRNLIAPHPLHFIYRVCSISVPMTASGNHIETTGYIGVVGIAIFLFGWRYRNQKIRILLTASLMYIILSFGPTLSMAGIRIPMPFRIFSGIPGLEMMRTPSRFMLGTGLCIALIAALFLSRFRSTGLKNIFAFFGILIVVFLDFFPFSMTTQEAHIPKYSKQLAKETEQTAVLNIPADWTMRRYQFEQIFHNHPICTGFVSRMPDSYFHRASEIPLFNALTQGDIALENLTTCPRSEMIDLIKILNVGTVILHRNLLPEFEYTDDRLSKRLGMTPIYSNFKHLVLNCTDILHQEVTSPPRTYYTENWYPPENWQGISEKIRWVRGRHATISVLLPPAYNPNPIKLTLKAPPLPPSQHQRVEIKWNGDKVAKKTIPHQWTTITLNVSEIRPDGLNELTLEFDTAIRLCKVFPDEYGDCRLIAAAVQSLRLTGLN